MKILLTGSHGQLARAIINEVTNRRVHTIVPFSHAQFNIADAAQVDQLVNQVRPDVVINAAAYNFVDQAELEPEKAFAVNKTGPGNLARATASKNIPIIHVSTDYVFDGELKRAYLESDKPNPLSVYGRSKLAGENAVFENNSRGAVVRTAWVYNVGGRNFPLTILSLKDKPELRIVNDQFGCPTYAPHLARKILELAEEHPSGLYHMAGAGSTSWYDFARMFFRELGISTPIKPISAKDYSYRAPRPHYTVLSTERGDAYKLPAWEQGVSDFVKNLRLELKV